MNAPTDLQQFLAAQEFGRQALRRPSGSVEAVDLARPRVIHHREQVAADAVHHRRHDTHDRVDCDCSVHRVAASREQRRAGLRREWMFTRGNAASRHHDGSPLRAIDRRTRVVCNARTAGSHGAHYGAGFIFGMYDFFTLATTVNVGPATLATSYSITGPRKIDSDRSENPKSSSSQ